MKHLKYILLGSICLFICYSIYTSWVMYNNKKEPFVVKKVVKGYRPDFQDKAGNPFDNTLNKIFVKPVDKTVNKAVDSIYMPDKKNLPPPNILLPPPYVNTITQKKYSSMKQIYPDLEK